MHRYKESYYCIRSTEIYTDIKKQSYRFAVEKYGFLLNLQLANQGHSESANIDLLIGSNKYWGFATGEIKRDNNFTLVAQKSIFGYLVSSPLTKTNNSKPESPSHVLKIVCKQDNCMNEKINRFWELPSQDLLTQSQPWKHQKDV